MTDNIPDYMRGFDISDDWGMTPVTSAPTQQPAIDPNIIENSNLELSKVKEDVRDLSLIHI